MTWPLALGALGAAALIAWLAGRDPKTENTLNKALPARKRRGGSSPLVSFTRTRVPWKKNRKGETVYRYEVAESPAALALAATEVAGRKSVIELTPFALAALMASEAGNGADLAKVAIAHAALTMARAKNVDVKKLLMPDGKFGAQQGRYASTLRPPSLRDVELAEQILAGKIDNPTPGAVQWDSPRTQDQMLARKVAGYTKSAAMVAEERMKEGKTAVYLPGVDPSYLRLWRT